MKYMSFDMFPRKKVELDEFKVDFMNQHKCFRGLLGKPHYELFFIFHEEEIKGEDE